MNWLVWECNKQTSHSIHSGNWANTCAFRFGCWFRTCLASTCENGVVQRPKAYREFSNDQWYQNYCGYNQKQHPSGSAWSFQHSSTYLNIFQLWFTFPCFPSHMCSPFSTHNGPQVPTGCRLRVGREWRTWQPGKCLVFDDSYEHEERAYSGWPWRTNEIMRGKSWEK